MKTFLNVIDKRRSTPHLRRVYADFMDVAYVDLPAKKFRLVSNQGNPPSYVIKAGLGPQKPFTRRSRPLPAFGPYILPSQSSELTGLEPIIQCGPTVKQFASRWLELIEAVSEERLQAPSEGESITSTGLHTVLLSLLGHKMKLKKSCNFQTAFGIILYQNGTSR